MFVKGKSSCFVGSISAGLSGRARAQSFPNSGWYSSLPALKLIEKLVMLSKPITMHFPTLNVRYTCNFLELWLVHVIVYIVLPLFISLASIYSIYLMLRCKTAWLSSTVTFTINVNIAKPKSRAPAQDLLKSTKRDSCRCDRQHLLF